MTNAINETGHHYTPEELDALPTHAKDQTATGYGKLQSMW